VLFRSDPRLRRWTLVSLLAALLIAAITLDWITRPPSVPDFADLRDQWQPSEAWLYDRDGHLLDEVRVDFNVRRLAWTKLDSVSPALRDAVIAAEDRRFYSHGGVDWLALGGSLKARISGERSRGASTLTMQLAAYLSPEIGKPGARGWLSKLRQMRAAWAIEDDWSKAQVLEAYLNLAPFRGEAQGVGAAALTLFGKAPATLDRRESAVMIAVLPGPPAPPALYTLSLHAALPISNRCIHCIVSNTAKGKGEPSLNLPKSLKRSKASLKLRLGIRLP